MAFRIRQHAGVDPLTGLPQVSLHEFDVVDAQGNPVNNEPLHPRAAGRLLSMKLAEPRPQEDDMAGSNQEEDKGQRIKWRKIGGGSFRMLTRGGKTVVIKPNQVFEAYPDEVPQAFRDVVVPVNPMPMEGPLDIRPGGYEIKSTGPGWYGVFDHNGKKVNEKGLRREDAQAMLKQLVG